MKAVPQICRENNCFGCSLCYAVCPVSAITMVIKDGFWRPSINDNKCVRCNCCVKACASNRIDSSVTKLKMDHSCYAAYSNNAQTHYNCSSGGLCTELSREFLDVDGVIVGAYFNPQNQHVEHILIDDIKNLELLRGSKYVQSDISKVYCGVRKALSQKNKVLFIGVPCEVYAIKLFAERFECLDNLYTIDIFCHGAASPSCFYEHIKNLSKYIPANISFRGGDNDCRLTLYNASNEILYCGPQYIDPYFWAFMKRSIYQRKCYECDFAGSERPGDLSVGDFWSLDKNIVPSNGGKGVNAVIVNSEKGQFLLNMTEKNLVLVERPLQEAVDGNDTLKAPTIKPVEYDDLWEKIRKVGFIKGLEYYSKNEWKKRYKESVKDYKKYKAKQKIKKVLPDSVIKSLKKLSATMKNNTS